MKLENYLKPNILNSELKEYKKYIEEFFFECNWEFKHGQKRDNCGVIAAVFYMFMLKKDIEIPRVSGDFVVDVPMVEKLDFYKNELNHMKEIGLNPNEKKDRIEYMKMFDLEERQKRIPHYWNQDSNGLIIDLSGYSQFIKSGLAENLNNSRYELQSVEMKKTNNQTKRKNH